MKHVWFVLFVLAVCLLSNTGFSQTIVSEDFESYEVGAGMLGNGLFTTWDEDPGVDGAIADAQAASGTKSLMIESNDDVIVLLTETEGLVEVKAKMYVPADHVGNKYFIIMNEYTHVSGPYQWALQLELNSTDDLLKGPNESSLPLVVNAWAEIKVIVDLASNTQDIYYNNEVLAMDVQFAGDGTLIQIAAIDLYAADASTAAYIDDVVVKNFGPLVDGELSNAGELLVELSADDPSAGQDPWVNTGSLADFTKIGDPYVTDIYGPPAMSFNNDGTVDAYQCQENAPAGIIGVDPTRSIEVWALNETIVGDDSMVSWGHRGGPNGTNMSFTYNAHNLWGACGHWGGDGPDLPWYEGGGAPELNQWHHLVYTYDGSTTRVYSDGEETNSETLAAGAINTHAGTPITIAQQITAAGGFELPASMYIGLVRVHDEALLSAQVQHNYDTLKDYYALPLAAPVISGAREADFYIAGDDTYAWQLSVSGFPEPTWEVVEPVAGATIVDGLLTIDVSAQPATLTVTVKAVNSEGEDQVSWEVTQRAMPVPDDLEVAGRLLVWMDAEDLSAGTEVWENRGTLREFVEVGDAIPERVAGVQAVTFDGVACYQSADNAPAAITGVHPTHTVEAWVLNPDVAQEESLVSWSKRGGGCDTNMAFNYGYDAVFGAIGHWCGSDVGWVPGDVRPDNDFAPEAGKWHYLTYTYEYDDGTDTPTTKVYIDGVKSNEENIALNAYPDTTINIAAQMEGDGVTLTGGLRGTLSIARLRISTEALTETQVAANFDAEIADFAAPVITNAPADGYVYTGATEYAFQLSVSGLGPFDYTATPAEASIDENGLLIVPIPDPEPDAIAVTVTASNDYGSDEATWEVQIIKGSQLINMPVHRYPFNVAVGAADVIGGADGTVYGDVVFLDERAHFNNDGSQNSNGAGLFPDPEDPDKAPPGAYIDLPNGIISALGTQATFEAWVEWNGPLESSWQRIFDFGISNDGENLSTGAANSTYIFATPRSGANTLRFGYRDGPTTIERFLDDASLLDDNSYHIVGTWNEDMSTARLFVNGIQIGEDTATHIKLADLNDVNNWLGRAQWPDPMLSASYLEFRIYNYALSRDEVFANYNLGSQVVNWTEPGTPLYIGDANCSGKIDLSDAICILTRLFGNEGEPCKDPCCEAAMDTNNDNKVDLSDAVRVLSWQFTEGDLEAPDGSLLGSTDVGCKMYDIEEEMLPCETTCTAK